MPADSSRPTHTSAAAELRIVQAPGALTGTVFPIAGGGAVIGRAPECDIRLDFASVSRRHATLSPLGGGRWLLRDTGSRNGVEVNSSLVTEQPVGHGDRLTFGTEVIAVLEVQTVATETEAREVETAVAESKKGQTVAAAVERARTLLTAGAPEGALQAASQALALDPTNAAALALTREALDRMADAQRKRADVVVARAERALDARDLTTAAASIKEALGIFAQHERGIELDGRIRQAIQAALADLDARVTELFEQGEFDGARELLKGFQPADAASAVASAFEKNVADVAVQARQAIERARQLFEEGQGETGIELLERFSPPRPAVALALDRLRTDVATAREEERKARERRITGLLAQASDSLSLDKFEQALAAVATALTLDAQHERARELRDQIEARRVAAEREEKERRAAEARRLEEERRAVADTLASVKAAVSSEAALAILRSAVRRMPNNAELVQALATREAEAAADKTTPFAAPPAAPFDSDMTVPLSRLKTPAVSRGGDAEVPERPRSNEATPQDATVVVRSTPLPAPSMDLSESVASSAAGKDVTVFIDRPRQPSGATGGTKDVTVLITPPPVPAVVAAEPERSPAAWQRTALFVVAGVIVAGVVAYVLVGRRATPPTREAAAAPAQVAQPPVVPVASSPDGAAPVEPRPPAAATEPVATSTPEPAPSQTPRPVAVASKSVTKGPSTETPAPPIDPEVEQRLDAIRKDARRRISAGEPQEALAILEKGLQIRATDAELLALVADMERTARAQLDTQRNFARTAGATGSPLYQAADAQLEKADAFTASKQTANAIRTLWLAKSLYSRAASERTAPSGRP